MDKLRLGFNPYTFARVSVMKSELIKPDDYPRLLKMDVNELLRYLQDSQYRKEIDEMDITDEGIDEIELALNNNLIRIFKKLRRISDNEVMQVIDKYLLRYDMENIKSIVRSKFVGVPPEKVRPLLIPSLNFSDDLFMDLLKKDSVKDIIKSLRLRGFNFKQVDFNDLFEIENALDKHYYAALDKFAKSLPSQGRLFRQFMEQEKQSLNIKTIVRFKREKMEKSKIEKYLIKPRQLLLELIKLDDMRKVVSKLHKNGYIKIKGDESMPDDELLTQVEIDLITSLLNKESLLMHKNPFTVDIVLGYMFKKEIEVKNLKILAKGKQLGMDDKYLENLLAIA